MSIYNHEKPWLARVLIPFWCIQILIIAILFVLVIWAITVVEEFDRETGMHFYSVTSIILLIFLSISFLLNIAEMTAFSIRKLRPLWYLISNVIKTAFWTVYLVFTIIAVAMDGPVTELIIGIIIFLAFLATLIYASIIYHRYRQSIKYNLVSHNRNVSNSPAHDFTDWFPPELETSYDPHHAALLSDHLSDPTRDNELHLLNGSNSNRNSTSKPHSTPLTAHELDVEAEAALHSSYRQSLSLPQRAYEPLRPSVYEMESPPEVPRKNSRRKSDAGVVARAVSPMEEVQLDNEYGADIVSPSSLYVSPVEPMTTTTITADATPAETAAMTRVKRGESLAGHKRTGSGRTIIEGGGAGVDRPSMGSLIRQAQSGPYAQRS